MESVHHDSWNSAMTPEVKHRRMVLGDISNQVRDRENCSGKRSLVTPSTPARCAKLVVLEDDCLQIGLKSAVSPARSKSRIHRDPSMGMPHKWKEEEPGPKQGFLDEDDHVQIRLKCSPSSACLKRRLHRDPSIGIPHIWKKWERSPKQAFFDAGTEFPPVDDFIGPPDSGEHWRAAVFEDPDGHGSSEELAQALLKGAQRMCYETQLRDPVLSGEFDVVDCNSLASTSPQQLSEMLTPDSIKDEVQYDIPPMDLVPVLFNVDFDFDSDSDECMIDTSCV